MFCMLLWSYTMNLDPCRSFKYVFFNLYISLLSISQNEVHCLTLPDQLFSETLSSHQVKEIYLSCLVLLSAYWVPHISFFWIPFKTCQAPPKAGAFCINPYKMQVQRTKHQCRASSTETSVPLRLLSFGFVYIFSKLEHVSEVWAVFKGF